jgi:hypothetical protein
MRLRINADFAAAVSVAGCDRRQCDCGNIHLRFHDEDGRVFAVGVMAQDVALEVAQEIVSEVAQISGAAAN